MTEPKRPNVLVLFSDQHNADCMGCAGHQIVKTPHLDALAASGTRFNRTYCQDAICGPSRVSLLTGMYPRDIGVLDNPDVKQIDQARNYAPWQQVMQAQGIRTGYFGKLHVGQGALYSGWDRSATCLPLQQDPLDESYRDWVVDQGYGKEFDQDWNGSMDYDMGVGPTALPQEYRDAEYITVHTEKFLTEAAGRDEPFFCMASFHGPHQPYVPGKEFEDMYKPEDMPFPDSVDEPIENLPPHMQQWRNRDFPPWNLTKAKEDPFQWKRYVAAYYAMVTEVDHYVGRLLAHLDQLGLREDTIVIYMSDHGDFVGRHGMIEKCALGHNVYEETIRSPLIVSWPGQYRAGAVSESLIELIDIYPTLAEVMSLERPANAAPLQGRSLVPILADGADNGRDYAFTENWSQSTIVGERYKLGVWVDPGEANRQRDWRQQTPDQLFDRERDPLELNNLVGQPEVAAVEAELRAALHTWWEQTPGTGRAYMIDTMVALAKK